MTVYETLAQMLVGKASAQDADLSALSKKGLTGPGCADEAMVEFDLAITMASDAASAERWRKLIAWADQAATSKKAGILGEVKRLAQSISPTDGELARLVTYLHKVWAVTASADEPPAETIEVGAAKLDAIGTPVKNSGARAVVATPAGNGKKPHDTKKPEVPPSKPEPTPRVEGVDRIMSILRQGLLSFMTQETVGDPAWPTIRDTIVTLYVHARSGTPGQSRDAWGELFRLEGAIESGAKMLPPPVALAACQLIVAMRVDVDRDNRYSREFRQAFWRVIGYSQEEASARA